MTWFTDSPYEKMMTQKPGHGRHGDSKPPVPVPGLYWLPLQQGASPLYWVLYQEVAGKEKHRAGTLKGDILCS